MRVRNLVSVMLSFLVVACGGADSPSQPATYGISGVVSGAVGVTVSVTGPESKTATSDANGSFSVAGLPPGNYTITPTQPGFIFTPVESTVTISTGDVVTVSFSRQQPSEGLNPLDANRLDAEPDTYIAEDKVMLPNGRTLAEYASSRGITLDLLSSSRLNSIVAEAPIPTATGPQQKKNDVISIMVLTASDFACARRPLPCLKWNYSADPVDPIFRPAQTGLTYVYGGKTPSVRTRPTDGCKELTYGMDCSGMVSKLGQAAGLNSPDGSAAQSVATNWPIPADWKLKMKAVTDGSIETGDLIAWPGHIGIAESSGSGSSVSVISATGSPGQCPRNATPPRGPRPLTIAQLGRGAPTVVLRLVTTLSGTFDMYIRCTDQSSDAAVIRFVINNDQGGPFSATGTGIDYNGTPLSFVLKGDYDQISNIAKGTLSFSDNTRSDTFSQKLLDDDTGYFPLTKAINNGGCAASIRLVRVNAASARESIVRNLSAPIGGVPASSILGRPKR